MDFKPFSSFSNPSAYRLFEEIALARISSTLHRFFAKLAQTDLLILDDFRMKVLDGQQLLDFMEIIEDRHGQKATIIISQLPVADWYDVMKGNTTAADAILDRLVHTSVRFELKGASLRQNKELVIICLFINTCRWLLVKIVIILECAMPPFSTCK